MKLSNATAVALVEAIADSYSHSELDLLFLRLDAERVGMEDEARRLNKIDRVRPVVQHLRYETTSPTSSLLSVSSSR